MARERGAGEGGREDRRKSSEGDERRGENYFGHASLEIKPFKKMHISRFSSTFHLLGFTIKKTETTESQEY